MKQGCVNDFSTEIELFSLEHAIRSEAWFLISLRDIVYGMYSKWHTNCDFELKQRVHISIVLRIYLCRVG